MNKQENIFSKPEIVYAEVRKILEGVDRIIKNAPAIIREIETIGEQAKTAAIYWLDQVNQAIDQRQSPPEDHSDNHGAEEL